MRLLDLSLPSPAENLALDEVLLEAAELEQGEEALRFWESSTPFVVVGYANRIASEVNTAACATLGIPVLRRCSGGGTVVQGPGCLNYALTLRITAAGPTRNITSTNRFVMGRHAAALTPLLPRPPASPGEIAVRGHTDLAIGAVKFSGNSQRRRKQFLLFHGTILYAFDLRLLNRLLKFPSHQPAYRASRPHDEFVTNLQAQPAEIKRALAKAWGAIPAKPPPPMPAQLLEKYRSSAWNQRF